MSKPLKEDYIIRIKSRIEQRLDEPAAEEEKEEFVELMTRGSLVLKGGSYYVTYRETETTGYEGCTTTLKIAADGSRVAMLRFGKGGGAGTQLLIEKGKRNLCHYETEVGSLTLGVKFDESMLSSGTLNYLCFQKYSREWANFVLANRRNTQKENIHAHDIVYVPIAHDKVGVQIRNFMEGNIDFDTFLKKLAFMKGITFQYFFGTQRAIDLLEKI